MRDQAAQLLSCQDTCENLQRDLENFKRKTDATCKEANVKIANLRSDFDNWDDDDSFCDEDDGYNSENDEIGAGFEEHAETRRTRNNEERERPDREIDREDPKTATGDESTDGVRKDAERSGPSDTQQWIVYLREKDAADRKLRIQELELLRGKKEPDQQKTGYLNAKYTVHDPVLTATESDVSAHFSRDELYAKFEKEKSSRDNFFAGVNWTASQKLAHLDKICEDARPSEVASALKAAKTADLVQKVADGSLDAVAKILGNFNDNYGKAIGHETEQIKEAARERAQAVTFDKAINPLHLRVTTYLAAIKAAYTRGNTVKILPPIEELTRSSAEFRSELDKLTAQKDLLAKTSPERLGKCVHLGELFQLLSDIAKGLEVSYKPTEKATPPTARLGAINPKAEESREAARKVAATHVRKDDDEHRCRAKGHTGAHHRQYQIDIAEWEKKEGKTAEEVTCDGCGCRHKVISQGPCQPCPDNLAKAAGFVSTDKNVCWALAPKNACGLVYKKVLEGTWTTEKGGRKGKGKGKGNW
jgi:hypothetical protein